MIIFTGGVGENSEIVRAGVCLGLEFLGVDFDKEKSDKLRGVDAVISKDLSKVTVMMITTNEELVIAQDTLRIVKEEKIINDKSRNTL
jgi:acetate kinase